MILRLRLRSQARAGARAQRHASGVVRALPDRIGTVARIRVRKLRAMAEAGRRMREWVG